MDSLECFPMGSSALLLAWKSPQEVNGKLTGFRIYYQEVDGTQLGPVLERQPRIINPQSDKAKLAGLRPHSKYRVCSYTCFDFVFFYLIVLAKPIAYEKYVFSVVL